MAAAPQPMLVSLYEYLHSDYRPDMDYVDGILEERKLGEREHSELQSELLVLFRNHRQEWKVRALVEQRVRVGQTRYRVPDVTVMPASWRPTPIVSEAPILCIEVLSPEDRFGRMRTRCQDYLNMGVRAVWIIDPAEREAHVLHPDGTTASQREGSLRIEGTPIEIDLRALFAVLDE